jgi:ABC-type bacteriocin/lantibiotic exporter with double-glycine peptidase domain
MIRLLMNIFSRKCLGLRRYVQIDYWSCGKQSVKSVLNYYGDNVRSAYYELGTTWRDGTDERQIRRFFKNLGYKVKTIRSIRGLIKSVDKGYPVIIWLRYQDHWCVFNGYSENYAWITDPNPYSLPYWDWDEFRDEWGYYGLEIRG